MCKITKLFKDTILKIAFQTTISIGKLLNEKQETISCEQSGIRKELAKAATKYILDKWVEI
jgi:hypothetical protein